MSSNAILSRMILLQQPRWGVAPGQCRIMAGASWEGTRLQAEFEVKE
jgi:hypothetical protein